MNKESNNYIGVVLQLLGAITTFSIMVSCGMKVIEGYVAYEELNVYIYPLLLITFSIWIAMQGESSIAGLSLFLSFVWYFWLILL